MDPISVTLGFIAGLLIGGAAIAAIVLRRADASADRLDVQFAPAPLEDGPRSLGQGEVVFGDRLNAGVALRYRDAAGALTERVVTVQRIAGRRTRGRGTYITSLRGWCHLRQDHRTFLGSRVEAAYDPHTGEVIDDLGIHLLGEAGLLLGDPPPPPSALRGRDREGEP